MSETTKVTKVYDQKTIDKLRDAVNSTNDTVRDSAIAKLKEAGIPLRAPNATKLAKVLAQKKMMQADVLGLISEKFGIEIGKDRLSRMCSGKMVNVQLRSMCMIADVLGVKLDAIVETEQILLNAKADGEAIAKEREEAEKKAKK